jgi:hypothetical protein
MDSAAIQKFRFPQAKKPDFLVFRLAAAEPAARSQG